MKNFLFCTVFLISANAWTQSRIDITHYKYEIELSDRDDTIRGIALIHFVAPKGLGFGDTISLDLANTNKEGRGMIIKQAYSFSRFSMTFKSQHEGNVLRIVNQQTLLPGDSSWVFVNYHGLPTDGLIISTNQYGQRTFFSDNWPNRARHWIPCVDHPADKASVEFLVTAPAHYEVVANGILQEERQLPGNKKVHHWKEDVPLPTKIMVIGVADFAVDTAGYVNNVPVTSWVFPQNKKAGFYDYAQAKDILSFFIDYIGPYPYKKLANVQSKTIFGGMENASAIFYYENSITGKRKEEGLIAHEVAHQWFGDMVTEKSYPHLWLSEGFATYLKYIFLESKYGTERLEEEMKNDRWKVIEFAKNSERPVVDSLSPHMELLNANSYQKGGWVLHMLRRRVGDSIFQQIVRRYYADYTGKNADTRDFQKVCEKVSGHNLAKFFEQWLYTPGIPRLDVQWKYDTTNSKSLVINVDQLQAYRYRVDLEIQIKDASGKSEKKTLEITDQSQKFTLPVKEKITGISLDPGTSLLFDTDISKMK